MLHHVEREQLVVERGYRRREHDERHQQSGRQRPAHWLRERRELRGGARGRLPGWMKRLEERDQRGCLHRAEVLPVRRHVAATLDDLPDQLILSQPHGDSVERRATLPTRLVERMTVPALLRLEDERAVPFERGASLEVFLRNRLAAPRVHRGAPGRMRAETRQRPPCHRDEKYGENGDRTASPALLAFAGEKRQRDEKRDADGRRDQQERSFGRGRQIREDGVEPPEEEVRLGSGLDDGRVGLTSRTERAEDDGSGPNRQQPPAGEDQRLPARRRKGRAT